MKKLLLSLLLCFLSISSWGVSKDTPQLCMEMLQRFQPWLLKDYVEIDSLHGTFKGENTFGNDEKGVRTNADLSMIAAFLQKYSFSKSDELADKAMKSLRYAIDTHRSVRKYPCKHGKYWGSSSQKQHQWESSLWAFSVAWSAYFQWENLTDEMKSDLHKLLVAECNYELERAIPTGFKGDTKAEENGWEVDVLAAALGLFPNDSLAPRWYQRMNEFAINSYSHPSDASNSKIVDEINQLSVAALYKGANLYPDWTLQNHDFFHTSYQNVVIQELGEAYLALSLFSKVAETQKEWPKKALLHNCDKVTRNVLNWLTLPDGEQAMPNGNDWSLFLYDQITSYSTIACFLGDADALYFERQAANQIANRQKATSDGSWLLRADVGGRRMGVEAHRVMMSYLMHQFKSPDLNATTWNDFMNRHSNAQLFPSQKVVRALYPDYFACFGWSEGKKSYTGYFAPLDSTNNNLVVPFRKYNTGNLIGYYKVKGHKVNAVPASQPIFEVKDRDFIVRGSLYENDSTLLRKFVLKTSSKGLIYEDEVQLLKPVEILEDHTGMLAISTDEFTRTQRNILSSKGTVIIDKLLKIQSNSTETVVIGDESIENSIKTIKVYPFGGKPLLKHRVIYKSMSKGY